VGNARRAGWTNVLLSPGDAAEHVREAGGDDDDDGARGGGDAVAKVYGAGGGLDGSDEDVLGTRGHGSDDVGDAEGD